MPPVTVRDLIDRRVPQYLAIYLGASWGLVQFVDFIGTRYGLSPRWTDLTLLAIALLLPSVLLYTYHHGRPGPDSLKRTEKVFIPLNVVLLAVVLTFVGAGSNLSAVTTRVTVKDEKGNTIEAVVPTKAYRKRVAIFNFDGPVPNEARWLSFGIPWLVYEDLQQQQFVQVVPQFSLREHLRKAGYGVGTDVPLALKRKIATDMHLPIFVTGRLEQSTSGVSAHVQIYHTETARLVKELSVSAPTPAAAADRISEQLLVALEIPVLADSKPDMPVAELLTNNANALDAYLEAQNAIQSNDNWPAAHKAIERAVKLDPTFAEAQRTRYVTALFTGQPAVADSSIQAALDHSYRTPERMQQFTKAEYYFAKREYQRAYAVLDMLSQLYPEDIQVLEQLVAINAMRDNRDALIASLKKVLELDPTRAELLQQLGKVYELKGDANAALKQYEEYARRFPADPASARALGALYRRIGEHAKSRAAYEQALLAKPNDVETLLGIAVLDRNMGAFAGAEQNYRRALAGGKTAQERAQAHAGLAELYEFMGEIAKSMQARDAFLAELATYQPAAIVLLSQMTLPGKYAQANPAKAEALMATLRKQLPPPFDMHLPRAEIWLYDELGDAARLEPAVAALDRLIQTSGLNVLKQELLHGRARLNELRGNCTEAIRLYREEMTFEPLAISPNIDIGRCYRALGRTADAEKALTAAVRVVPAHGPAHLELALLYKAAGDAARAKQHADRARATWKQADATFKPLKELAAL